MERPKQLIVYILAVFFFSVAEGQHTIANVTLVEQFFSSPGYIDNLDYGFNMTRDYRFHTNYPGHKLLLKVDEFVLEPADKNGACLYDRVVIYDGYNLSAPGQRELCGTIDPGTTYSSSGNTVYVVFTSDGSFNYKGFQFSIVSDGPVITTTTIKSTATFPTSTTRPTTTSSSTVPSTTSSTLPTTTNLPDSTTTSQITSSTSISTATQFSTSTFSSTPTFSETTTSETTSGVNITSTSSSPRSSYISTLGSTTTTEVTTKPSVTTESATDSLTTTSFISTFSLSSSAGSPSTNAASTTSSTTARQDSAITVLSSTVQTTKFRNDTNSYTLWVILGCCTAGFLLLIVIIVALYRFLKKKERTVKSVSVNPLPDALSRDSVGKTAFSNGKAFQKNDSANIFDMDLPSPKQKANLLPPVSDLSSVETV